MNHPAQDDDIESFIKKAIKLSKSKTKENVDTHFIFESRFGLTAKSVIRSKDISSNPYTDGQESQDAQNNNVHEFARYHWIKSSNTERLICTSLTGFCEHMKTESDLNKDQFRPVQSSIGDDLDIFAKQLNNEKYLVDLKVLFLNQKLQSKDEFRLYRCARLTSIAPVNKFIIEHSQNRIKNYMMGIMLILIITFFVSFQYHIYICNLFQYKLDSSRDLLTQCFGVIHLTQFGQEFQRKF